MIGNRLAATVFGLGLGLAFTLVACSEDAVQGPYGLREGDVAEVRGTVLLETGAGLPGATVELERGGVASRSAETDSKGRYSIGVPEAGTWELVLTPPAGYALPPEHANPVAVDVDTAQVITMDLEAAHALTVTVGAGTAASPDTIGGEPGVPVRVTPAGESTPVATAVTGDNGAAGFALPAGTYDVGIDIPAGYTLDPKTPDPQRVELLGDLPRGVGFFLIRQ